MADNDTQAPALSDYEKARALKIERNNAKLRSLGLISLQEESISNGLAWGRPIASLHTADASFEGKSKSRKRTASGDAASKNQRSPKRPATESNLPRRSSQRLQGIEPLLQPIPVPKRPKVTTLILDEGSVVAPSQTTAGKNPTATYAHCLHRVRTMTDKQLENRIRVIERAMGAHCIVKLSIMASCCRNEGKMDLSDQAAAALERVQTACLD